MNSQLKIVLAEDDSSPEGETSERGLSRESGLSTSDFRVKLTDYYAVTLPIYQAWTKPPLQTVSFVAALKDFGSTGVGSASGSVPDLWAVLVDSAVPSETATSRAPSWGDELIAQLTEACELAEGEPRRDFMNRFMRLIRNSDFEFGFSTPADDVVRKALQAYGPLAREWINRLFLDNFEDAFVTSAVLRVIAHFEYEQMYPQGMTMATAAVSHLDTSVRECGIRCFENWENASALKILKSLHISEEWLRDYLETVIASMEGLAVNVPSR